MFAEAGKATNGITTKQDAGSREHSVENGFDVMVDAVQILLCYLGEDHTREGLLRTPLRVSKSLIFAASGPNKTAEDIIGNALFTEYPTQSEIVNRQGGGEGGMVTVRDINLFSCCIGCLLPLRIRCHVAYIPARHRVVGLSKLPRIGVSCSRCLQSPSRFAGQLVDSIHNSFCTGGVAVMVESWHLGYIVDESCTEFSTCTKRKSFGWRQILMEGKQSCGSASGDFRNLENGLWDEFLAILGKNPSSCCLLPPDTPKSAIESAEFCTNIGGFRTHGWSLDKDPRRSFWNEMVSAAVVLVGSMTHSSNSEVNSKAAEGYVLQLLAGTGSLSLYPNSLAEGSDSCFKHSHYLTEEKSTVMVASCHSLPLSSLCEHHLLPFFGRVHVGFVPPSHEEVRITESDLERIVTVHGRRLQVQERLTMQIAEAIMLLVQGRNGCHSGNGVAENGSQEKQCGVIVIIEASHLCVASRGVEKTASNTVTVASLGCFATSSKLRSRFLGDLPNERMPKF